MKENSLFSKYIWFILGIIYLTPGVICAQTFKHYEGIANKKGDWDMVNGHAYQKTNGRAHV